MTWKLDYICKTFSIKAGGCDADVIYRLKFVHDNPEFLPLYKGEKSSLNDLGQAEYYIQISELDMITKSVKIYYDEDWPRYVSEKKL